MTAPDAGYYYYQQHREVKYLAFGDTARKWQSPVIWAPKSEVLTTPYTAFRGMYKSQQSGRQETQERNKKEEEHSGEREMEGDRDRERERDEERAMKERRKRGEKRLHP